MPRYFFNLRDGDEVPDIEGVDLGGLSEARQVATAMANELTHNGQGRLRVTVVVTDEFDNPGFEVTGVG